MKQIFMIKENRLSKLNISWALFYFDQKLI